VQNTNDIKNIVQAKFKEKLWCNKKLEGKRKLKYYEEVVNPNIEDQKYLSFLTSLKKRMNVSKIRTNYHELDSKTPWHDRISPLSYQKGWRWKCDTKRIEDEKHFLLECHVYTQIRCQF